nr:NADH dehydrogenase subunit 6 [Stichophthalma howqua]
MMKMFVSTLIISFSIMMFFTNHPVSMGLLILLQTLMTCMILGTLINSYWFSYILFLIFLGGLLVLFMYMSSTASNELLKMSPYLKMMLLPLMLFIFTITFLFKHNLNWLNFSFNEDMNIMTKNVFLFSYPENNISLFKLYNNHTYLLMIMMISYLFIALIAVVKITNIFFGPLRTFN